MGPPRAPQEKQRKVLLRVWNVRLGRWSSWKGAEALVALDAEPHPLRHLLYGQVAEPLEGQSVEHGRRFLREVGMPVRYSCVLV